MRIAHFVGTLKKDDGVGRVIFKITEGAEARGHQSVIFTGLAENPFSFHSSIFEVPSFNFPLYKDYHLPLPGLRNFESNLKEFRPQIIHLHSPDPLAWSATIYGKKNKVPVISTHHTNFTAYLPYYHLTAIAPLVWAILRNLYNRTKLVTTPSDVMAKDLKKHGVRRVITLPWGIDTKSFNPQWRSKNWRQKVAGKENTNIILFVSRLTWEKDLETLVQTYNLLQKYKIDFVLVVVGEGPAKTELKKLMPKARFLGYLKDEALYTAYASADIFLFPSTTETFGNVTIEAMAAGLVPVVANAGGSKFIVRHKLTGLLSKPKNAEDFYKNVVFLIQNRDQKEKMARAGLDFVKLFGWEKILDRLFKIYSATINKTNKLRQ
jgi:glycosyltransferase involved in cell wall biosynthesis